MVLLVVAVLLACAPPAEAQRPKGKEKDPGEKTTEKMVKAGQIRGTITSINESKKSLKLKLKVSYTVPDKGAIQAFLNAQRDYQVALLKRDVNAAANAQRTMLEQQARMYKVESKDVDYEVQSQDEVVVRTMILPERFDDRGKVIKKFTREQLKELKGDPKLPGYKAEFSDLIQGQLVEARLVRKPGRPPRPKKGKDALEGGLDALDDYQPHASMILILGSPPPPR